MLNLISFFGIIFFVLFFCIYVRSIILYLKIRALKQQRPYKGFIEEHFNFFLDITSFSQLPYYLPFAKYLKPLTTDTEEMQLLWQKKYKLELYLLALFVLGLFAIPTMEYVVYPFINK